MQKQAAANGRRFMDAYFERIRRLSSAEKLESRLRFMLMDVIEQRARGWESRRKKEGPMKIEVRGRGCRTLVLRLAARLGGCMAFHPNPVSTGTA